MPKVTIMKCYILWRVINAKSNYHEILYTELHLFNRHASTDMSLFRRPASTDMCALIPHADTNLCHSRALTQKTSSTSMNLFHRHACTYSTDMRLFKTCTYSRHASTDMNLFNRHASTDMIL